MITYKKYAALKKVQKEAEIYQMRNCKRMAEIRNTCVKKEGKGKCVTSQTRD